MGLEHVLMVPMVEFIRDVARVGFKYIGETRKGGRHVIRERFRYPYYIIYN